MARLRSWARRAALVLLGPLLFLSLAEGVLRLARVGSPASFFLPARLRDQPVWTDNAFYTRRYFEPGLERAPWPFTLPRDKSPGVTRIVVLGESGAGLVKARATAKGEVTGLDIDPSILVASEKEVVEDLILAAIHDAQAKARARSEQEMARLAEQMGVPPGMKLPF